ncbi:MAG: sigma-E processing peptidase SpoIIGA [Dethiobacteria bacterium]|jgi:stage II sporulation protein GA (sporulation sigma-E factor processing peptidase)|nr:sigma-E processing peptidase SpoIIGA [Bacillota bacterium]
MYLDLLFFISVVMHYFLLLFTAKLFHRKMSRGRLLAGASLGALAVLLLPYPHPTGLTVTVILLAPLLMVSAAFWPLRFPEILFYGGAFFLVAFTVAGAITALLNYTPLRLFFASPRGSLLLFGTCTALYLLFVLLRPFFEEKKWQKLWRVELQVAWQGKKKIVPAFLDTGNRLQDPFSSLPVIVIDYRSLEGLLPPSLFRHLADEEAEPWSALEKLSDPALACCFTLIPCRGVGRGSEILLGLKPDDVVLLEGGRSYSLGSGVFLGLTRRGFGPAADYQALLPPSLLRAG